MTPIRILLAEDHALVRAGLKALVGSLGGMEVIAEAPDGRAAIEAVASTNPDVILMDISMPGLNGFEALRRMRAEHPSVRVIIVSMHDSADYVWMALRAGAAGYLLKDAGPDELDFAIRAVARGGSYLSPSISRQVVDDFVRRDDGGDTEKDRLTPRQREIVQLVAEGQTNQEIADLLAVSVKTVQTHRAALMDRLGVHDVTGIVRYAIRTGLSTVDR
ncbi:MAG: response regulator transcription factor [Chloroflexota bacterium]|nr:response regulator transcription factor [Chloroflexota bacterium]